MADKGRRYRCENCIVCKRPAARAPPAAFSGKTRVSESFSLILRSQITRGFAGRRQALTSMRLEAAHNGLLARTKQRCFYSRPFMAPFADATVALRAVTI